MGAESSPVRAAAGGQRRLPPLARALLLVVGTLMLALGVLGAYLPVLPTTPFLLLAAVCYVRSSERAYRWLVGHPRLGPHLNSFLAERAVSWRVKVVSLGIAWVVLGGLALLVVESPAMKALLLGLAGLKTLVMLRLKTSPH